MNTKDTPQPAKPRFFDLFMAYFDTSMLAVIADLSGVAKSIVDVMFVGTAVERTDAEKVLAILSQMIGKVCTLDTVGVPVLPDIAVPQSEVARLKAQIELEYQAGQQALRGSALGTAQHRFITTRMEIMAKRTEELRALAGDALTDEFMKQLGDEPQDIRP